MTDGLKVSVPLDMWKSLLVLLLFIPTCMGPGDCGEPIASIGCKGAVHIGTTVTSTTGARP